MDTQVKKVSFGENKFQLIQIEGETRPKDPIKSEDLLPSYYLERKFYRGGSDTYTYEVGGLPGNIVKYDAETGKYEIATLVKFTKSNPPTKTLVDSIIYSSKVASGFSLSGSFLIGGIEVGKDQAMEIIIEDVVNCLLEDSMIDFASLNQYVAKNAEDLGAYYFIKGCVLSTVTVKKFKKSKFTSKINASFITLQGDVYSSQDKFSSQRLLSLELVSLKDYAFQIA